LRRTYEWFLSARAANFDEAAAEGVDSTAEGSNDGKETTLEESAVEESSVQDVEEEAKESRGIESTPTATVEASENAPTDTV
jgi:hypothetical protein